jgi:hypothetical protein
MTMNTFDMDRNIQAIVPPFINDSSKRLSFLSSFTTVWMKQLHNF